MILIRKNILIYFKEKIFLKCNLHTTVSNIYLATFIDGIHFFDASSGNEKQLAIKNGKKGSSLKLDKNSDNLAVVKYGENLKPGCHVDVECNEDLI
jgi:hypothetical protein